MSLGEWLSIIALLLVVPLGVASNLLTPRFVSFLEKRSLIKKHKSKQQALQIYTRLRAFREGKRDKYPYYFLLAGIGILCAIAASTTIIIVVIVSPEVQSLILWIFLGVVFALVSVACLAGIYETARQLERFEDYEKEFEQRWGPIEEKQLH